MKTKLTFPIYKGGPGSGDFGHTGRPGQIGGSSSGGGGSVVLLSKNPMDIAEDVVAGEDWNIPHRVRGDTLHVGLSANTTRQLKRQISELQNDIDNALKLVKKYTNLFHDDIEPGQTDVELEFDFEDDEI